MPQPFEQVEANHNALDNTSHVYNSVGNDLSAVRQLNADAGKGNGSESLPKLTIEDNGNQKSSINDMNPANSQSGRAAQTMESINGDVKPGGKSAEVGVDISSFNGLKPGDGPTQKPGKDVKPLDPAFPLKPEGSEKPIQKPGEKPGHKPGDKPGEKPGQKPGDKPDCIKHPIKDPGDKGDQGGKGGRAGEQGSATGEGNEGEHVTRPKPGEVSITKPMPSDKPLPTVKPLPSDEPLPRVKPLPSDKPLDKSQDGQLHLPAGDYKQVPFGQTSSRTK